MESMKIFAPIICAVILWAPVIANADHLDIQTFQLAESLAVTQIGYGSVIKLNDCDPHEADARLNAGG